MTLSLGVLGSPPPSSVVNIRNSGSSRISLPSTTTDGSVFMFSDSWTAIESSIKVDCDSNSHYITVKMPSPVEDFSGMVYPQVNIKEIHFMSDSYDF